MAKLYKVRANIETRAPRHSITSEQFGKYNEIESLYQQILAICKKALGPEHSDTVLFAVFYKGQGKYNEAKSLYQWTLEIHEKALDPEHSDIASSLNNLTELYQSQSKHNKAEPLF
ncbi:hypothetical protein BC936DRAFT_148576 [Jimgerdemannia flammicorona]|uniref:Tetratricopeptide repeat-domain-containing protein n=1 Tax=Jimgerdemannia flammicorona TaxID=994334 RepID=A0A433D2Q7_9FUNG|nr:hypothetical protein BC936DRAFT_148576 [Jimgerdemannia flammicorona]